MALQTGDQVPAFSTTNQLGETVTAQDLLGKKVVLYFYPKDSTPGCTAQACDLRDHYDVLLAQGYTVLGISPDSEKSHQKFKAKFDLPFDLLADVDHTLAEAFGVWVEKSMYGKTYMGIARTTFICDEAGKVVEVISKVDTKAHTAQILK